jgi:hypothetical protein
MRDIKSRLIDVKKLKFEVRDAMRYDDVGDYFDNTIVAYDFKDDVITNAIFLHEFVEYMLIKSAGIDPSLIDKFDTDETYEDKFPEEFDLYGKFHDMANFIERQFIENLGLNWEEYDKKINTAKINIAMEDIYEELHKAHPDEDRIEKAKEVVKDEFEETKE